MSKHLVILRCSRTTAIVTITASICLFILIGCTSLFRSAGLTDEQALQQTAELKAALSEAAAETIQDIQTGFTEGHDLKTIAIKASSTLIWKIIAAGGASLGIILNGLLAKWLGTEKKINKALITGIETANDTTVKESVAAKAIAAGIESQLHRRVQALT